MTTNTGNLWKKVGLLLILLLLSWMLLLLYSVMLTVCQLTHQHTWITIPIWPYFENCYDNDWWRWLLLHVMTLVRVVAIASTLLFLFTITTNNTKFSSSKLSQRWILGLCTERKASEPRDNLTWSEQGTLMVDLKQVAWISVASWDWIISLRTSLLISGHTCWIFGRPRWIVTLLLVNTCELLVNLLVNILGQIWT